MGAVGPLCVLLWGSPPSLPRAKGGSGARARRFFGNSCLTEHTVIWGSDPQPRLTLVPRGCDTHPRPYGPRPTLRAGGEPPPLRPTRRRSGEPPLAVNLYGPLPLCLADKGGTSSRERYSHPRMEAWRHPDVYVGVTPASGCGGPSSYLTSTSSGFKERAHQLPSRERRGW